LSTLYDLITVILFAGLAILFLQRSMEQPSSDRIIHYLPAAVGCAGANWLGNHHQDAFAIVAIVATAAYAYFVLKPFQKTR
jgi:hypothetical protein